MSALSSAVEQYDPAAVFGLFSGGHDSLASTALASDHPRFTGAVHINTGIGIEATREFVRETCAGRGWPLFELFPPDGMDTYERLVLTRGGFPNGPKSHNVMYWNLKEKALDGLIRRTKRHRRDCVALVTGIRRDESTRRLRAGISVPIRKEGGKLWVNPILDWTARACGDLIEERGLKRSMVVDLLHRSGECLCGALAHHSEIREIEAFYPAEAARIHALEARARELGLRSTRWATRGDRRRERDERALAMCGSCQLDWTRRGEG